MPDNAGGSGAGPTPGVFGRAALGSCLAMGITMYAAKLGIAIETLEVEIQADYDDGAMYGVSDSPPGYTEVRYAVRIESTADEDAILHMLDEADRHSPYLDVFQRAQACRRSVQINRIAER
ncbi:MAG: OsmC family protein [Gemmatimonadales bacterium]|nr:OsmC family protein [Gemmatimonadales bacterium]